MFTVSKQGWGVAIINDIYAVLNSVRFVMGPFFDHDPNADHLFVGHSPDNPVSYPEHGVILLNTHDRYWDKYSYQFAHEYCHFLIGGKVPQQLRWFEESICELASYYFLPRLAMQWKTTPPYPNWTSYAPNFIKYVENDMQKMTPFDLDFSRDPCILDKLIENEYDRPKNAYVAHSLHPIFSATPTLWSTVPLLALVPPGMGFSESLLYWHDQVPEKYGVHIEAIAKIFGLTLKRTT